MPAGGRGAARPKRGPAPPLGGHLKAVGSSVGSAEGAGAVQLDAGHTPARSPRARGLTNQPPLRFPPTTVLAPAALRALEGGRYECIRSEFVLTWGCRGKAPLGEPSMGKPFAWGTLVEEKPKVGKPVLRFPRPSVLLLIASAQ